MKTRWYLTQAAIGEPEIDIRDEDEDLTCGYSLMRELAADSHGRLTEIREGLWIEHKGD